MLVSARGLRLLFESCAAEGVSPVTLTQPLGVSPEQLASRDLIDWAMFNVVLDRLEEVAGGDDRLRAIGRRTARVPASRMVQKLARSLVSPYRLYDFRVNWFSAVNFQGLRTSMERVSGSRIHIRGWVAPPHRVARALFVLAEGSFTELSTLLGLPRAVLTKHSKSSTTNADN